MIIVTEPILGTNVEYETITEFVNDFVDDSYIEGVLNEDFGTIELPLDSGEFGSGSIMRKMISEPDWECIKDDYIQYFCEEIEDELDWNGSAEFGDFIIRESEEK